MRRRKGPRRLFVVLAALLVIVLAAGVPAFLFLRKDEPERFADAVEHFKYGSIGLEADRGVPYYLWVVLPEVFPDLLPDGQGAGYERFGFLFEPGSRRPIGVAYRDKPVQLAAPNCAACHTGTVRAAPGAPRQIVFGMPANGFRLQEYVNFLRAVGKDPRFDADTLMAAIDREFPDISHFERLFYRHVVIPATKDGLERIDDDFSWTDRRPPTGPGRNDAFNTTKALYDLPVGETVGTSDFPSIWNQRFRRGLYQHWDGNNADVDERSIGAAIFSGASEDAVDIDSIERVVAWLERHAPPRFPASRIDRSLAARGEAVWEGACASCHSLDGERLGEVVAVEDVGTDPGRVRSFTAELLPIMNSVGGDGYDWSLSSYRKTNGYVTMPLDGLWLRAPYLHNGSVPTLRALLFPEERPDVFWRGYDVYDWENVGFVASGAEAERVGFRYDTSVVGNDNGGHLYGTELPAAEREALLEYLKTL